MINQISPSWGVFKQIVDAHPSWIVNWIKSKLGVGYHIISGESDFIIETVVSSDSEIQEFESGIKIRPGSIESFNIDDSYALVLGYSSGRSFRSRGDMWSIPAGSSNYNCDLVVPKSFEIEGMRYWHLNAVFGDTANMQIVDGNDLYGFGAGAVIVEYGTREPLRPSSDKDSIVTGTRGSFPAGMTLRIEVTSVGSSDIMFGASYFLRE